MDVNWVGFRPFNQSHNTRLTSRQCPLVFTPVYGLAWHGRDRTTASSWPTAATTTRTPWRGWRRRLGCWIIRTGGGSTSVLSFPSPYAWETAPSTARRYETHRTGRTCSGHTALCDVCVFKNKKKQKKKHHPIIPSSHNRRYADGKVAQGVERNRQGLYYEAIK